MSSQPPMKNITLRDTKTGEILVHPNGSPMTKKALLPVPNAPKRPTKRGKPSAQRKLFDEKK